MTDSTLQDDDLLETSGPAPDMFEAMGMTPVSAQSLSLLTPQEPSSISGGGDRAKRTSGPSLSDLRKAAHAGYMAACRDVYALVEETRKSSNITDDFTRGRCYEAKGIARTMNALGTDSDELRKALGEVMRASLTNPTEVSP